jgi:hypothetical protein
LRVIDVINVVANTKDADKGKGKNLQIMITHNDGAEYRFLAPPITDADGKNWGCSVTNGKGRPNVLYISMATRA